MSLEKLCKISNLNLVNITPFFFVGLNLFSFPMETSFCFDIWHSKKLLQNKTIENTYVIFDVYMHQYNVFVICKLSFLSYLFGKTNFSVPQ